MIFALSDTAVIIGIIGIVVVVLAGIAILYLKKKRNAGPVPATNPGLTASRFAYQPETRAIPKVPANTIPRPVAKKGPAPLPQPKEIGLIESRTDISESLAALVEKYSLDQFTIATSDGLVFASSGAQSAQNDAAHYSEIFINDPLCETPGVVLSGINYKGSDLILIIGTPLPVPEEIQSGIENDTKDILNWWI
jgi:hypothetical protein